MDIKFHLTQEKLDEHLSIETWLNMTKATNGDWYNLMINSVVDDDGNEVTVEDARILFKKTKKKEWSNYVAQIVQAIGDTYVSPTKGGS